MRFRPLVFLTVLALFSCSAFAQDILLWPQGAPGALGNRPQDKPNLTPYLSTPAAATGSAMILFPGGRYGQLVMKPIGPIVQWLNSLGIKAFVLKYRLGTDGYRYPVMLEDAQRAVRYVRSHAAEYGIDPHRIGVMGFSAGGHLAALTGTRVAGANPAATDPLDRVSSRPDLMVLLYPVITMGPLTHVPSRENLLGPNPSQQVIDETSNEKHVTADTPPTFLAQGANDAKVPVDNSLMFAAALRRAGVAFELHVFEKAQHGFGLQQGDPALDMWPKLCEHWLREHGF